MCVFIRSDFFLFSAPVAKYPGGQIVDVGLGQMMHLFCKGHGKPVGKFSYEDSVHCVKHDTNKLRQTLLLLVFIELSLPPSQLFWIHQLECPQMFGCMSKTMWPK